MNFPHLLLSDVLTNENIVLACSFILKLIEGAGVDKQLWMGRSIQKSMLVVWN